MNASTTHPSRDDTSRSSSPPSPTKERAAMQPATLEAGEGASPNGVSGPLGPEFEALLRRHDASAESAINGVRVVIRDEEGTLLFWVTPSISVTDLETMFNVRSTAFTAGVNAGQEQAKQRIRAALGL